MERICSLRRLIVLALVSASMLAATACGDAEAETAAPVEPAPPDLTAPLPVEGVRALVGADGRVAVRGTVVGRGVLTADGSTAVTASAADGWTSVRWIETATGSVEATVVVEGVLDIAAVDLPGTNVALVTAAGEREGDAIAPGRSRTEIVVIDHSGERFRRGYEANLLPEGFANWYVDGSTLPGSAFVLEFTPPDHPTHYRVRTVDLTTGELGLPLNLRDKTKTVDQLMAGVSRTQVLAARDGLLFTLYRGHHDEGHGSYAFVHTLGLGNGVWCLVVPDEMELEHRAGALGLTPSGRELVLASANGTIATIPLARVTDANRSPDFDAPVEVGPPTNATPAVATGHDALWVGLGHTLVKVDPDTLAVIDSAQLPTAIDAIAELPDGTVVIADKGRLTTLTAELDVVREDPMPDGIAIVHRIVSAR